LDIARVEFIQILSSSYNLSVFSSKDGSYHDGGSVAALRESSSMSIGDLWPEVDSSCRANREGTFMTATHRQLEASSSHQLSGIGRSKKRKTKQSRRDVTKGVALGQPLGPSSTPPKGCSGSSVRNKATRILADASRDISPRMKKSLAERRYSPSTDTDRNELGYNFRTTYNHGLP
jgi:hypothetical protein